MAGSDALKIAFYIILILALVIAIYGHYTAPPPPPPPPPQPQLVTNQPAGLYYKGPETTALAGYYCIEGINSSNGYSIQLNALLSNGLWIQDIYSTAVNESINGGPWVMHTAFLDNVWSQNTNKTSVPLHYSNPSNNMIDAPCAWLVMVINDGNAYFGYSLDGKSIVWYDSYPVGNAGIIPSYETGIALAGNGNGAQAVLGNGTTLVFLALYYWNGTSWEPAPVSPSGYLTAESVNNAYVFTSGTCGGVVSWPNPVNETICPSSPSFKP